MSKLSLEAASLQDALGQHEHEGGCGDVEDHDGDRRLEVDLMVVGAAGHGVVLNTRSPRALFSARDNPKLLITAK